MKVLDVNLVSLAFSTTAVFVASIIRGYSGFGFAMVAVTSLSLMLPPIQVVPTVLILEVMASINLVPYVWRDIDWFSLRWLLAGSVLATPFGVYLLATIPAAPMRISISLIVLTAAVFMLRGWAWQRKAGRTLIFIVGAACGMLNGAAAIGGPPVILFYLSSPAGVTVSRASMIAYFLGIDAITLIMVSIQGLTTSKTLLTAGACLPSLILGIAVGRRIFKKVNKESFRHHVLILLIVLSISVMLRSIFL